MHKTHERANASSKCQDNDKDVDNINQTEKREIKEPQIHIKAHGTSQIFQIKSR